VPGDSQLWTTVAGLRAQSLKAWNSGALLRELLEQSGAYPRRRSLKRPTAAALLSDYAAAQRWAAELFAGAGPYQLETMEVGRRTVGSNRIPAAAVFATAEDEIGFVGKSGRRHASGSWRSAFANWIRCCAAGRCGGR
jgi:hypothetical protein